MLTIADSLDRLIDVHQDHAQLRALITIYVREMRRIHALAEQVRTMRGLGGEGAQLDQVGRLVRRGREGLSDADYRVALRCEIRALRSLGRADDVIDVLALALPDGATFELVEAPPHALDVEIYTERTTAPLRVVWRAKAAGVALFVAWSPEPVETSLVLAYDDEDASELQGLAYDDEDAAPGGALAVMSV